MLYTLLLIATLSDGSRQVWALDEAQTAADCARVLDRWEWTADGRMTSARTGPDGESYWLECVPDPDA